MSALALSTRVNESAVISKPVTDVWEKLKAFDFSWWSLVASVKPEEGAAPQALGANYTITFKDGTRWVVHLVEWSELSRSFSFEVVSTDPSSPYSSAIHTLALERVTSSNESFLRWTTEFSNDVSPDAVLDSKYKKLEAFNDLRASF